MRPREWLTLVLLALTGLPAAGQSIEFNRDIRPILSEHCFTCHGPDTAKRKAGLRLDTADGGVFAADKQLLIAGKHAESELYRRLVATDRKRMPPASTGKQLTQTQVNLVRRWIDLGAKYQPHWAYISPTRPGIPTVKNGKWARNDIDRFLLARLESEGLSPSTEADRRILIRRLSLDLLGLPPTPDEVDAFVNDKSDRAYEDLVERFLRSRHFGERMALYWLDLVRFADTGGYHSDNHRDITLYRDWVINAFNGNLPFDRFTIEQLAGDLLPAATNAQRIASGYNRLLQTTEEGGAQAREYLAKYAADRVRNAASVWLGLTIGCAECHNHKYDPITTLEFYRFAAFWADISEVAVGRQPQTKIPTPEYEQELAQIARDTVAARKVLDTPTPALAALQRLWEEQARVDLTQAKPSWVVAKVSQATATGSRLVTQSDGSLLSTEGNPAKSVYTINVATDLKNITGLRLSALQHPSLNGGLSRGNGNFVLTNLKVSIPQAKGKPQDVKLQAAEADFSQEGYPVVSLLTGKGPGWAVEGHIRKNQDRTAVVTFARPIPGGPNTTLVVRLEQNSQYPQHNIGRLRLDLTTADKPGLGDRAGIPEPIALALKVDADKRSAAQTDTLAAYYRSIAPALAPERKKIAELEARRLKLDTTMPQTLISKSVAPRTMRVLPRGNWLDDSGQIVQPGTPAALPPLKVEPKDKRATRLELANWLVSREQPLTSRVFVNRLWKLYFGQGLVSSLEDFGAQGTWPSHPELLDYLADEFPRSGWDVKHMIRLMVTSSTYRQTSVASKALRERDPYNLLLARQARYRIDAELVRDNALSVSSLLSRKMGGPSVKPYQPAGYWAYLNFPVRSYVEDKGEDQYRRGVYTYIQRTFPHPSLAAFDAPSREECTVDRPRSNTPQQALVLLNDPTYVEAARVLAERTLTKGGNTDEERLNFVYRRVLNRSPRPQESALLLALKDNHLKQYQADRPAAEGLLSIGQTPVDANLDKPTLAAWLSVTRTILNLHETITRE